ncbi:hypothetical protein DFJ74DRAFT_708909 [Hyaloraphidium curvatum]|nr:hypothetical protein DFJ74DRAFT_708909 [Hyaloraphidium curvatum]
MAQTPPSTPPPPPGLAATVFYEAASATGFFRTGAFLSFLESGEHSDIKVVGPDGSERRLHRMVICAHSGFFRAALKHEFKESADAEVRPLGASVTAKEGKMLPIGGIGELKVGRSQRFPPRAER